MFRVTLVGETHKSTRIDSDIAIPITQKQRRNGVLQFNKTARRCKFRRKPTCGDVIAKKIGGKENAQTQKGVKIMADLDKMIEEIEKMTVMELNDLVKKIEEKFGVSAAAMAVAAPAAGAAAPAAEEQTEFTVVLKDIGPNKIPVIKVVRELTSLGLSEAKALVDGAPSTVKENVSKAEAEEIANKFKEVGATVELK